MVETAARKARKEMEHIIWNSALTPEEKLEALTRILRHWRESQEEASRQYQTTRRKDYDGRTADQQG